MKLVVTLLAAAVFAFLICPASFVRKEEWDGECPTKRWCITTGRYPHSSEQVYKNCTCVEWGCVIDKVYYSGIGCEGEDMICKDGVNEDFPPEGERKEKIREGECDLFGHPPITSTSTTTTTTTEEAISTTTTTPKPTTEEAMTTTTSGTVETKYGAWKFVGMALIGCFVFFFSGQLW